MLMTCNGPAAIYTIARYWSKIVIFVAVCRNIAITFGVEKLESCGYPMVKKF